MAFNEIFNRSKIITLENAGHGLIYQCPIEIADEITKWCLAQNIKNTRPIKSYVRREGRITPAQKKALQELWPKYGLNMDSGRLNLEQVFNRNAKTILEIGFGMGDSLIQMAQENSDINFIGIDVYAPGVGSILNRIEKNKLKNVKIFHADAVDVLKQAIPDKSLARIHIYFPDPWQKKRHHKRRLIQKDFIALLSKKLQKGGILHIVTDHDDYATHILDATFGVRHQKLHQRTINRPVTKFEKRAKKLGHQIHEFEFVLE
ncbi:MAG: tRNA (guanosine(46)-N7)-methyltransferase TrmB [Gammaproteobacteria bacterium]|nr:tRNA (guanosine(46)-N7)-methyltransferase TrmB [Gammaproteobacteria bacterium]